MQRWLFVFRKTVPNKVFIRQIEIYYPSVDLKPLLDTFECTFWVSLSDSAEIQKESTTKLLNITTKLHVRSLNQSTKLFYFKHEKLLRKFLTPKCLISFETLSTSLWAWKSSQNALHEYLIHQKSNLFAQFTRKKFVLLRRKILLHKIQVVFLKICVKLRQKIFLPNFFGLSAVIS